MANIQVGGITYTTDSLTCCRMGNNSGEWKASLHDHYHAIGFSPEQALTRLAVFLKQEHPSVWGKYRDHFKHFNTHNSEK